MSIEILINVTPQETRVAVVDDGVLQEVQIERARSKGIVGNIYRGKAKRVLPGMQAAFIEIGLERTGFLHANEITLNDPAFSEEQRATPPRVEQLVHEGETVWVQVLKDPVVEKGARLTTELSIPSRYFVYMPNNEHIGISQKIELEEDRQRLLNKLTELLENEDMQGGFIIRTLADTARDEELASDLVYLRKAWKSISESMRNQSKFGLVHEDIPLALRTLRDLVNEDVDRIRIDSKESHARCREFAEELIPSITGKLEWYSGERPLFSHYGVEEGIQSALHKRVGLECGGYLIFDQTEAMSTIDVNTGAYVGKRNQSDTIFKTNLEAAREITRQIRLRNLGGLIIIDFIDMLSQKHRKAVCDELQTGVKSDRIKTRLSSMSELGLVQLTRKRSHNSLEKNLCESCSICSGTGTVKTTQTVCYQIFRDLLREARRYSAEAYTVVASKQVVDMLIEEESSGLADLETFINTTITLREDKTYRQEQYDIVLI